MKFIPLRTAVIAGTCAVALSFVSLPAFADTTAGSEGGSPSVAQADPLTQESALTESSTGSSTDPASTDSTTVQTTADGSSEDATTDTSSSTDPTTDPAATDTPSEDPSTGSSDEATPEPVESAPADDATTAPTETPAPAPVLPGEKGHPKQAFAQTVFLPKAIAKHGIHVTYSGLTPKATYQPFYNGGQSGGELGKARRANAKGVIDFVYHFSKSEKWATTLGSSFGIGLLGYDTDLRLQQQVEIKYASDAALTTQRHGTSVDLAVSVDKAGKSGAKTAWKKVAVHFQKKVHAKWVTVKTVRTNAKGVAKATVTAGKSVWRAVVDSGTTVAGTTTKGHKK